VVLLAHVQAAARLKAYPQCTETQPNTSREAQIGAPFQAPHTHRQQPHRQEQCKWPVCTGPVLFILLMPLSIFPFLFEVP